MASLVVEICTITSIRPHASADRLEVAEVKGWQCVVSKGKFCPGDLCVYFPPDSVIPVDLMRYLNIENYLKHLPKDSYGKRPDAKRVGVAKIRGIPSYGVITSVSGVVPEDFPRVPGYDVSEILGIEKYESPEPTTDGEAEKDHPLFHRYTEIENIKNFPDVFEKNESVIFTEKIHGCLKNTSRISMADGTNKRITEIRVGEEVLGLRDGKIIPTKVTKIFNNGKGDDWLTVQITRKGIGRGNSFSSIICTQKHRFWNPSLQQYVFASDLCPGDNVLLLRSNKKLTTTCLEKTYKPIICEQQVVEIFPISAEKVKSCKYDLETETHNYFANSILVHNSNVRLGYIREQDGNRLFMAGSHSMRRREYHSQNGRRSIFWTCFDSDGIKEMMIDLGFRTNGQVIVFGEVFGSNIQDMWYGQPANKRGFSVFDITVNGKYLDQHELVTLCDQFQVKMVPTLYTGPFSMNLVKQFTDGPTSICKPEVAGKFKGREGIVIRPEIETIAPKMGARRKILKSISFDYLNRKGGTEYK